MSEGVPKDWVLSRHLSRWVKRGRSGRQRVARTNLWSCHRAVFLEPLQRAEASLRR